MTTISTIGSGKTYSTPQLWDDAAPSTLTDIWQGNLYASGPGTNGEWTTGVTMSGSISTALFYKYLTAAAGESFQDQAGKLTNRLAYLPAQGVAINAAGGYFTAAVKLGEAYCRVDRLQLKQTQDSGSNSSSVYIDTNGINASISSCIIVSTRTSSAAAAVNILNTSGGVNTTFTNCAIYGRVQATDSTGTNWFRNCTILRGTDLGSSETAISTAYTTVALKNCAVLGSYSTFFQNVSSSSSYTATNSGSAPGSTGNVTSLTATAQLTDTTSSAYDFRAVGTGSLDGAGLRDQTFTNDLDILGQSRSTSTPTIGAFEVVAGGTPGSASGSVGTVTATAPAAGGTGAAAASGAGVTVTATAPVGVGHGSGAAGGALSTTTASAPAAAATGAASATGSLPTATATAPEATASGAGAGSATGDVGTATATAPGAAATGAAAASGALSTVTATAPAATTTGAAATTGSVGTTTASAPAASATGAAAASGSIGTVTTSALLGVAAGGGAVGLIGTVNASAPTATATGAALIAAANIVVTASPLTGAGHGAGSASGALGTASLSAVLGTASGGTGTVASGSIGTATLSAILGIATGAAAPSGALGTLTATAISGFVGSGQSFSAELYVMIRMQEEIRILN